MLEKVRSAVRGILGLLTIKQLSLHEKVLADFIEKNRNKGSSSTVETGHENGPKSKPLLARPKLSPNKVVSLDAFRAYKEQSSQMFGCSTKDGKKRKIKIESTGVLLNKKQE